MKEIDFISMNKKRYDEIIGCVRELTSQRFCYLNLSDDIADRTPENCTSIRWTFYASMPSVQVNTCSLALKC